MAGIDSFTKVMLHCDGVNGSTTFTDDSLVPHTVTAYGDAKIDTSLTKFGTGAGLFDGTTDYLEILDSPDFAFGTGAFTIDFWVNFNTLTNYQTFYSQDDGGNRLFFHKTQNNNIELYVSGGIAHFYTGINAVSAGVWTHIALVRDGDDEYIFIDGISQALTYGTNPTASTVFPDFALPVHIGKSVYGNVLNGRLDEFRVSKGIARWTSNFTPDTSPYDTNTGPSEITYDINSDIRTKFEEITYDINSDIRAIGLELFDINADIRVNFEPVLKDIITDIRTLKLDLKDVNTDIRIRNNELLKDINTDIRVDLSDTLKDINTDIRVKGFNFKDINTDIRINSEGLFDINTDIRVANFINNTNVEVKSLYFEEGAYVSSNEVTLILDVKNAIYMQFMEEGESVFSAFEAYDISKDITLSTGDGDKILYVRFKDTLGNVTRNYSVGTTLITVPPSAVDIEAYNTSDAIINILDSVYQPDNNPFFRWRIPNSLSPYRGFSYAMDGEPASSPTIGIRTIIQDGLEVTKASPLPEMTLDISQGVLYYLATVVESSDGTLLLENGGVEDRIDIAYFDSTNGLKILKGLEAVSPVAEDLPEDGILLAEILVPAGTTNIADVTITDKRELYITIEDYLVVGFNKGQHIFNVKAFTVEGESSIATFNLYISNTTPIMNTILGYLDNTKAFEILSNVYQSVTNSIYLEWSPVADEPGPINYYYTTNGNEPTESDLFTTNSNLTLSSLSTGFTIIKIKPKDLGSNSFGDTKEFVFVYGLPVSMDETLVIGENGNTLKQSLQEVSVTSIDFDFNSARICKIFQPIAFDDNLPFELNELVSVVHKGETLFSGRVKTIERTIDVGGEGILYNCIGPRGELTEDYAHLINSVGNDSAIINFSDVPLSEAISQIINISPLAIKGIQNLPSGDNVFDTFTGQTVEQVISAIYDRTNYFWYMKPNGILVSVDANVINPGEAKFGVYGTTVNSINPQYNVISSNLDFDVTKRYNKIIIEGANKKVRVKNMATKCVPDNYNVYKILTNGNVLKIIETKVKYRQAIGVIYKFYNTGALETMGAIYFPGKYIISWFECKNNIISKVLDSGNEYVTGNVFPQGTIGTNNTVAFSKEAFTYWWSSNFNIAAGGSIPGNAIELAKLDYKPKKFCAIVTVDGLVEAEPLYAEVTISGTADNYGAKTLRLINTTFQYSEDPDDLIDDYDEMVAYAEEQLAKLNNIKVNGTITLDTVDPSWTLDKTVNLINTEQSSWDTLNAKVIGISYNFNQNTTTLQLTSEFLR